MGERVVMIKIERALSVFIAVVAFGVALSKGVRYALDAHQPVMVAYGVALACEALVLLGTIRLGRSKLSIWGWVALVGGLSYSVVAAIHASIQDGSQALAVGLMPLFCYFVAVKLAVSKVAVASKPVQNKKATQPVRKKDTGTVADATSDTVRKPLQLVDGAVTSSVAERVNKIVADSGHDVSVDQVMQQLNDPAVKRDTVRSALHRAKQKAV